MQPSVKQKTILTRFARTLGAVVIAALIAHLPILVGIFTISATYQLLIVGLVSPLLVSADKWLRYGSDPGEASPEVPVTTPPAVTTK